MSFDTARRIGADRLNEVLVFLNHIQTLEPSGGFTPAIEVKVMKGLFMVQLYGALEKTLSEAVQVLLREISSLKPVNVDVALPFNVVSMSTKWKSVKDAGYKDVFPRMSDFFRSIESGQFHGIEESLFADYLQNIWAKTIEDIVGALGMTNYVLSTSDRALLNELVDKRNAVAHGRESAAVIGERYQCADLRKKLNDIQFLINGFVDALDQYLKNRDFIQPTKRAHYP